MKVACSVIKDLLPLYYDEVCSAESRQLVDDHMVYCDACRIELERMNSEFKQSYRSQMMHHANFSTLKKIKKKLARKNVIVAISSFIGALVLFVGVFQLLFHYQMPIEYRDGLLDVHQAEDGVIDIVYQGNDYYGVNEYTVSETDGSEVGGASEAVVYLCYTDSMWTKYFSSKKPKDEKQFSIGNHIMVDYGGSGKSVTTKENITAIYYLVGSYRDLSNDKKAFDEVKKEAVLVWKK